MSPEKKALIEAARAVAINGDETPLEYMLRVMRDSQADTKRRDMMAMGAAPFIHPKLAAVEHSGNEDNPIHQRTRVELVVIDAQVPDADHPRASAEEAGPAH